MDNLWLAAGALGGIIVLAIVARLRSRNAASIASTFTAATYYGPLETETYVREHINDLGREAFPDNPDVDWIVHGFVHQQRLTLAEVEPRPSEVGYPRFKFGFVGDGAKPPRHVATYCLEDGAYSLLSSAPGAPRDLPRRLE